MQIAERPMDSETPLPVQEHRTNTPAYYPVWDFAGNDNPDPHQEPSRVIPYLMGV